MPGFPTAPAVQTVTDKLATIAPELGNVPGYYVYLKDPIAGTIYESASVTDSGGNWSIAGVTMGLTYQYSYGVHPNTAYPFRGAYVAANPLYEVAGVTTGLPFYNAANSKYGGGVRMDGVTDDLPAFKSVATTATVNGGKVVIPPGTAFCNYNGDGNGIRASTKSLIFSGAGRGATFFTGPAGVLTANSVLFSAAVGADIELEDMTITGPLNQAQVSIGVFHTGGVTNAGWIRVRRTTITQFQFDIKYDNGSSCEVMDSELAGFTSGASALATCVQAGSGSGQPGDFRAANVYVHDFGDHGGSNLNHAFYIFHGISIDLTRIYASSQFGIGYTLQIYGGTGTAQRCSITDFNCSSTTYNGILTSPDFKTTIVGGSLLCTNRAVITQFDCEMDAVTCTGQGLFCVQQAGGTAQAKIRIRGGLLSGAQGVGASIAGTEVLTDGVEFSATWDLAVSMVNGAYWTYSNCKFSNTGWNFSKAVYGDGNDGDFTLDGATTPTWATRSGSVYTMTRTPYLKTLTINAGVTLKTNNYPGFCWSFVGLATSVVDNSGNAAIGAAGGIALASAFFGSGSAGGAGTTTNGTGSAASTSFASVGGTGGAGGTSGANTAGAAGGVARVIGSSPMPRRIQELFGPALNSNSGTYSRFNGGNAGGGGAGDGTNAGGGGGEGGRIVAWLASQFNNLGTWSAKGGDGAAGVAGNAAGGGPGGGGFIGIGYGTLVNQGTLQVTAGAVGAGVGTGTAGAAGVAGNTLVQAI